MFFPTWLWDIWKRAMQSRCILWGKDPCTERWFNKSRSVIWCIRHQQLKSPIHLARILFGRHPGRGDCKDRRMTVSMASSLCLSLIETITSTWERKWKWLCLPLGILFRLNWVDHLLIFYFIACFTTTFLHTHSWLNWADEDDWWGWGWLKEKPEDTS